MSTCLAVAALVFWLKINTGLVSVLTDWKNNKSEKKIKQTV